MLTKIYDFVDEGLGHSSYLIDIGDGTTAIVDPPRFPSSHEALAAKLKSQITWTLDTHSHADYVTGSPGLTTRVGATFIAPAASHLETPHLPLVDGDRIELGNDLSLIALATPGHTPDHHAYLLQKSNDPIALFSGGSLMVGAIGRTDLNGAQLTEPLARDMFRSLRRFDDLPDDLTVYPTHGAGSFCSAPGSSERITTLAHERDTNPLFIITDEDQFVEQLIAGFGTFPSYFCRLPELNRMGPHQYNTLPHLAQLATRDITHHLDGGGAVIDVRPITEFGAGFIAGSMSITLRPVFGSWLGWLIKSDQPIAFVVDENQDRADLVRQCLNIGHEQLVGELTNGIKSWTASDRTREEIKKIDIVDPDGMVGVIVDVRQASEYKIGHVPGAINIELGAIPHAKIPEGALTIMCGHGERAMTAASILAQRGHTELVVLDGGPESWSAATRTQLVTEQ